MILLLKTILKNTVSEANCNQFLSYWCHCALFINHTVIYCEQVNPRFTLYVDKRQSDCCQYYDVVVLSTSSQNQNSYTLRTKLNKYFCGIRTVLATSVPIVLASVSEPEARSCYVNKNLVKKLLH